MNSSSESTLIAGKAEIVRSGPSQIIAAHDKKRRPYKRSMRNTNTTLLNADPNNFRAIVQKYTGRSAGIDISVRRKGPVTLDFRSPTSASKEVIFPISGDIQKQSCAIATHMRDGESHVTYDREGKQTASYETGQLSDDYDEIYGRCDDYSQCNYDFHNDDDHDIMREYLGNSSFNGAIGMDFNDFYHEAVLVEEFLMRDLDI